LIYPYVGRVRASRVSARMVEHAYQQLEAAGYPRTTLRTLDLVLAKAFGGQTGRTLGAHKPRESDDLRPVWTLSDLATVTVRRQRVVEEPTSRVREKPTKSHNGARSLLLDAVTLRALIEFRPQSKAARVSGHMSTGRGGQPLRPDDVTSRFNQLAVAAGVRPIGPHQIRTCSLPFFSTLGTAFPRWLSGWVTIRRR
jgi:hypothetical protein